MGDSYLSFHKDENGKSYYMSDVDERGCNHVVTIVGWDDTIPPNKFWYGYRGYEEAEHRAYTYGGWLVRNSWGDENEYQDHGYFYVSYDEISLPELYFTIDVIPRSTYKYNYHYDTTQFEWYRGGLAPSEQYSVFANIYPVSGEDESQTLDAVNLGIDSTEREFEVRIYKKKGKMNSPVDGTLMATQSCTNVHAGYLTYKLDNPVPLKKGEYFSVVLEPTDIEKKRAEVPDYWDYYAFKLLYDASWVNGMMPYDTHNYMEEGQSWYV